MTLELFTAIGALVGGSIAFLRRRPRARRRCSPCCSCTSRVTMARAASAETPAAADDGASRRPGRRRAHGRPRRGAAGTRARCERRPVGPGYRVAATWAGVVGASAPASSRRCSASAAALKVPLMHLAMGVPLRVATATSNLMVGITASASAVIYLFRGGIDPYIVGPTAVGVFIGATRRFAARPSRRPARPAPAVRRRAGLHRGPDAHASRRMTGDPRRPRRPAARLERHRATPHRRHYVSVALLVIGVLADGRRRRLAARHARPAASTSRPLPARAPRLRPAGSCGSGCSPSSPPRSAASSRRLIGSSRAATGDGSCSRVAILAVIAHRARRSALGRPRSMDLLILVVAFVVILLGRGAVHERHRVVRAQARARRRRGRAPCSRRSGRPCPRR